MQKNWKSQGNSSVQKSGNHECMRYIRSMSYALFAVTEMPNNELTRYEQSTGQGRSYQSHE